MKLKVLSAIVACMLFAIAPTALARTKMRCALAKAPTKTLVERMGYPADTKLLIVHADDLGVAHSVNQASIKGLESGLVSSASIMIPCSWLPEIAAYARSHPEADLGLHLTLTSEWGLYRWGPVLGKEQVPSLLGPDDVAVNSVISIEPSVTADGWAKFYADAINNIQPGITEMIVHLAYDDEEMKGITFAHPDWGSEWRQRDFQFVTSDAFRKLLKDNNVKLTTWREVAKSLRKTGD